MYKVYCHTFPNGKKYIGLTKTSEDARWKNGKGYKTCPLVNRAIEKYGWENVKHEFIAEARTKSEAESLERMYIKEFRTNNGKYGYNILPGGDVATNELTDDMRKKLGNGWRGKHRTEEEKIAISRGVKERFKRPESNGHFGMKASDETKSKMSATHKKRWDEELRHQATARMKKRMSDPEYKKRIVDNLMKHPPKPKPMSEETKQKLRDINTGRWINEKSPTSKRIVQLSKNGAYIRTWANAGEAERAGIALRVNIGKVCLHYPHCHTAGGYKWEFEENYKTTE